MQNITERSVAEDVANALAHEGFQYVLSENNLPAISISYEDENKETRYFIVEVREEDC